MAVVFLLGFGFDNGGMFLSIFRQRPMPLRKKSASPYLQLYTFIPKGEKSVAAEDVSSGYSNQSPSDCPSIFLAKHCHNDMANKDVTREQCTIPHQQLLGFFGWTEDFGKKYSYSQKNTKCSQRGQSTGSFFLRLRLTRSVLYNWSQVLGPIIAAMAL